jgi:hypothetical protein
MFAAPLITGIRMERFDRLILILVFNATFSIISAISWRPVLVVEEAEVPGEYHRAGVHCKFYA